MSQGFPVELEVVSPPREATTLEEQHRPTSTHTQATTARREHLTGDIDKTDLSKSRLCKIQRPDGPSLGQRQWTVNGGKGDTELSPKKCLQIKLRYPTQSLSQIFSNDSPLNTEPICNLIIFALSLKCSVLNISN